MTMMCPHCNTREPFFEAIEKVEILPTIEGWKFCPYTHEVPDRHVFKCVECEKLVKIDILHKHITPLESDPIFDEIVEKILDLAKTPEKRDELITTKVIDALKSRRFIGINRLMTGRELVSAIIEQKP